MPVFTLFDVSITDRLSDQRMNKALYRVVCPQLQWQRRALGTRDITHDSNPVSIAPLVTDTRLYRLHPAVSVSVGPCFRPSHFYLQTHNFTLPCRSVPNSVRPKYFQIARDFWIIAPAQPSATILPCTRPRWTDMGIWIDHITTKTPS